MNRFYYSASIDAFLSSSEEAILGELSAANTFELTLEQKAAWQQQIKDLHASIPSETKGHILFEYTIPRMGKRCDCVLIINNHIIILEFKCGSSKYNNQDKIQTVDYALDLKNFHGGSHEAPLIPVLVATESSNSDEILLKYSEDQIADCLCINSRGIKELIEVVCVALSPPNIIHPSTWINASYKPTPTIIEAAQVLYREHQVDDISRNDAEATNLAATSSFIDKVIADSKEHKQKAICFVTGVPGAGKTLAGLNLATSRQQLHTNEHAVFLSGNGPLVEVLQTALAQDKKARTGDPLSTARRETSAFIQNIHHFRDDHLTTPDAPIEKVVIFDEAQRAWTKEKAAKFMKAKKGVEDFNQSEPKFLLDVMDRHEEWCVVVALIGGGQEINDGEAGLPEWLAAVADLESDWQTHYSPELDTPEYTHSKPLTTLLPNNSKPNNSLHLSVSMRSFRAESLSLFINKVISNDKKSAHSLITQLHAKYPIYLTRDIEAAKKWVTQMKRGSERIGLVASAGAKRLVPHGVQVKVSVEPEKWFLGDDHDIRSSNFLELAASQFDIQGLEIDWAVVCWDGDLRHSDTEWEHHKFKGSSWQRVNKPEEQLYLRNAYRVLLTRARQGMVIFVPQGSETDVTRNPNFYDGTYDYLKSCGLRELNL